MLDKLIDERKNQDGFSLLEMIVAMGILIVLTVGGLLAYNGYQQTAKDAATRAAAKTVYTGATAYRVDGSPQTNIQDAPGEYNSTQSDRMPDGRAFLHTAVYTLPDDSLCVTAEYGDNESFAVLGADSVEDCENGVAPEPTTPNEEEENNGGGGNEEENDNGSGTPNIPRLEGGNYITTWDLSLSEETCTHTDGSTGKVIRIPIIGGYTYQYTTNETLKLPSVDFYTDWGDGSNIQRNSVSSTHGISHCYSADYSDDSIQVIVKGSFYGIGEPNMAYGHGVPPVWDQINTNEALISVDKWDNPTGIGSHDARRAFSAFRDAVNLVYVDTPPNTIETMVYMFDNTPSMKQDISGWDVSRVGKWMYFNNDDSGITSGLTNDLIPEKFRN